MEKTNEAWDESFLINAFDQTLTKFKEMHNVKSSEEEAKPSSFYEEASSIRTDDDDCVHKKQMEAGENDTLTVEGANEHSASVVANQFLDSKVPEAYMDSSNVVNKPEAVVGYSSSQNSDDYNKLLNEYYELEAKQQEIMQKLQQFGAWNYQYPAENSVVNYEGSYGAGSSQEQQLAANQASTSTVACSCCPCVGYGMMSPCSMLPPCSFGGTSAIDLCTKSSTDVGHDASFPPEDDEAVKTALEAAERAISSINIQNSGAEKNKLRVSEGYQQMPGVASNQTDITTVVNAWYSAGFYTGKYLAEQSKVKKQPAIVKHSKARLDGLSEGNKGEMSK